MKKIVCICTGNTCRSPMAAAILRRLLPGADVRSAGLFAHEGAPASACAQQVMREMGLDISRHRATLFSPDMAEGAVLVAMTRAHAQRLREMCPDARVETIRLNDDVPDPFGGSVESYRKTAFLLETGAQELVKRPGFR